MGTAILPGKLFIIIDFIRGNECEHAHKFILICFNGVLWLFSLLEIWGEKIHIVQSELGTVQRRDVAACRIKVKISCGISAN